MVTRFGKMANALKMAGLAMNKNIKLRIGRLEERLEQRAPTIICYFGGEETFETIQRRK